MSTNRIAFGVAAVIGCATLAVAVISTFDAANLRQQVGSLQREVDRQRTVGADLLERLEKAGAKLPGPDAARPAGGVERVEGPGI